MTKFTFATMGRFLRESSPVGEGDLVCSYGLGPLVIKTPAPIPPCIGGPGGSAPPFAYLSFT